MPRIGSTDHAMRTFVAFHLRDLRVLRGEIFLLPNVPGNLPARINAGLPTHTPMLGTTSAASQMDRQRGTGSMDHEGREEREGVKKEESRLD